MSSLEFCFRYISLFLLSSVILASSRENIVQLCFELACMLLGKKARAIKKKNRLFLLFTAACISLLKRFNNSILPTIATSSYNIICGNNNTKSKVLFNHVSKSCVDSSESHCITEIGSGTVILSCLFYLLK